MRAILSLVSLIIAAITLYFVKAEQARVSSAADAAIQSAQWAQGEALEPAANPEDLPLDERLIAEKTQQRRGKTIHKRYVAFGAWLSECVHSYGAGPGERTVWCDIYPWNGQRPRRTLAIIPFRDRATVQFYNEKPPKLVLHTAKREAGSQLSYRCGSALWQGPAHPQRLKFFYDKDAWPFIAQMRSTDCTLGYTPAGASKTITLKHSAHGFSKAYDYAKRFMMAPPRA